MAYIKPALNLFLLFGFIAVLIGAKSGFAQTNANPVIIRDTEIENALKEWTAPLLKVANIGENNVNFILVQSTQLNAFVAGGANIFLYTGLIEKTENPGELMGVIAHELGHIAGGHLIATRDAYERASYESILGAVVGIGAAIATGNGGAAQALILGSGNVAQRRFLAHTRVHESSADQAALRYLEGAGMNPEGLVTFFGKLESEELLPLDQQSEYMRTHPLTRNRIEAVTTKAKQSPAWGQPYPGSWIEQHARIKAKLIGFINPGRVTWVYNDKDKSVPARYARAIAAYRNNDVTPALKEIDDLITMEPENPYFQELKGQMLVDFGRVEEALPYYNKAVSMLPGAGLIRIELAHALLQTGGQSKINEAAEHLQRAIRDEPRSSKAHRLLAMAYGNMGQENKAKLHLAEEALLQGKPSYARHQAESVLKSAPNGSREWIHARDIAEQAKFAEKEKD